MLLKHTLPYFRTSKTSYLILHDQMIKIGTRWLCLRNLLMCFAPPALRKFLKQILEDQSTRCSRKIINNINYFIRNIYLSIGGSATLGGYGRGSIMGASSGVCTGADLLRLGGPPRGWYPRQRHRLVCFYFYSILLNILLQNSIIIIKK